MCVCNVGSWDENTDDVSQAGIMIWTEAQAVVCFSTICTALPYRSGCPGCHWDVDIISPSYMMRWVRSALFFPLLPEGACGVFVAFALSLDGVPLLRPQLSSMLPTQVLVLLELGLFCRCCGTYVHTYVFGNHWVRKVIYISPCVRRVHLTVGVEGGRGIIRYI